MLFTRYLAAKKTVDDRALNRHVWHTMCRTVRSLDARPLRILEIGSGIGTMLERLVEWDFPIKHIDYTAIDAQPENITEALERLPRWAAEHELTTDRVGDVLHIGRDTWQINAMFHAVDLQAFAERETRRWDVLIANAFLDLIYVEDGLPVLFNLLERGGVYYFTINFDGVTAFQPAHPLDAELEQLYHRSMDERSTGSRAGRRLFHSLHEAGAVVDAVGSSDWVVHPLAKGGYPADEAFFLRFILAFFEETLGEHSDVDQVEFRQWLDTRLEQAERGELVYIAHQLDYTGRFAADPPG